MNSTGLTEWFTCPLLGCPVKLPVKVSLTIVDNRAAERAFGVRRQVITCRAEVRVVDASSLERHIAAAHSDVVVPEVRGLGFSLGGAGC